MCLRLIDTSIKADLLIISLYYFFLESRFLFIALTNAWLNSNPCYNSGKRSTIDSNSYKWIYAVMRKHCIFSTPRYREVHYLIKRRPTFGTSPNCYPKPPPSRWVATFSPTHTRTKTKIYDQNSKSFWSHQYNASQLKATCNAISLMYIRKPAVPSWILEVS